MKKYPIKIACRDFNFLEATFNIKGTRPKRMVIDNKGNKAIFKYEGIGYMSTESCSEKLCYEIAKVLGYNCARIDLAKDDNGTLGILNYLFVDTSKEEHIDAVSYLSKYNNERPLFYTISNIKKTLDDLNSDLFAQFVKIMIFDALVGEQDRHEENWGIRKIDDKHELSPLYDNGDSLLANFKNEEFAQKYYSGIKDFDSYIKKSKTLIYKEDNKNKYKHFELIEYLNDKYHDIVQKEIKKLENLTDDKIYKIVKNIPNNLLTSIHKKYIILYLKKRRDLLLNFK